MAAAFGGIGGAGAELQNPNPIVSGGGGGGQAEEDALARRRAREAAGEPEEIDALEVFDLVRHINDPEHPLTLEQLSVVQLRNVAVDDAKGTVDMTFTPTIPHCSMATLIGLSCRVKLLRSLPPRFKVGISITPGTHSSEDAVNKQLNDKERVAAALENAHLLSVVDKCIADTDPPLARPNEAA